MVQGLIKVKNIRQGAKCLCIGKKTNKDMYFGYSVNGFHYFYKTKTEAKLLPIMRNSIGVCYSNFKVYNVDNVFNDTVSNDHVYKEI